MGKDKKLDTLVAKAERGTAKRRELVKLATRAGAEVAPSTKKGTNHDNVVYRGSVISQIPRHERVSYGVQKALVEALRRFGLIAVLVVAVWAYFTWLM